MHCYSLSGPTTHNVDWNPVYKQYLPAHPDQVGELRQCIAHHGAAHAIVQHQAGVKRLALRMPSFSDTPHVEVEVPFGTFLPCGKQKNDVARKITDLCYQFAGYVAEDMLNDGELRDIAAMDDYERAIDIAEQLGKNLDVDASLILIATFLVVESVLSDAYEVHEKLVKSLISVGFVSFDEFAKMTRPLKPCNFALKMLTKLSSPLREDEIERVERRLA